MQTRTRIAHVTRGICLYMQQTHEADKLPSLHPLSLPMTLGLLTSMNGVSFYAPQAAERPELLPGYANHIFTLAARYWRGTLRNFNTNGCIDLLLRNLEAHQQALVLANASYWLSTIQHITTRTERHNAMKPSDTLPPDIISRLDQALGSLEQSLLDKDPMMPQHLRNTHSLLISYPETVHLLEDHEIARIIDAAELHTKTEIVKAVAKGSSSGGSRKKVSVSDL